MTTRQYRAAAARILRSDGSEEEKLQRLLLLRQEDAQPALELIRYHQDSMSRVIDALGNAFDDWPSLHGWLA